MIRNILPGKSIELRKAEEVASIICRSTRATRVYLFGSTACVGSGNDIDLWVIVPNSVAKQFFTEIEANLCYWGKNGSKNKRMETAIRLLNLDPLFIRIVEILMRKPRRVELDIFLVPENWRNNPQVRSLNHRDPYFLDTVDNQLTLYDRFLGTFRGMGFFQTYFGNYLRLLGLKWNTFAK